MTVLVTGGCGYVGSSVVWALYRAGKKIVVVDDMSTGNVKLLPPGIKVYEIDMAKEGALFEICSTWGVKTLIHMAAKTSVPESVSIPMRYLECNYHDTYDVVSSALDAGVKNFVFSSTAAVYGDLAAAFLRESDITQPISAYGKSKLMAEWMLDAMSRRFEDMKYTVLRYFNVSGADPEMKTGPIRGDSLFKALAVAGHTGAEFKLYGDGSALRDFVHVTDVANAHVLAADFMTKTEHFKRLTLNVGYGQGYTVNEVVDAFKRRSLLKVVQMPPRAGDLQTSAANADRIQSVLGWRPRHHLLETMVNSALEWEHEWRRINRS